MKQFTRNDIVLGPFTVAPLGRRFGFSTHKVVNKIRDTSYVGSLTECEEWATKLNDRFVVYVMAKGTEAEKLI